jgi:acetylglutamate kinase
VLDVQDGQVSTVNWSMDHTALEALLIPEDAALLSALGEILDRGSNAGFAISLASPFDLLRELFTVRGSGTLVKRGSELAVHKGYAGLDVLRIEKLLGTTFGRRLKPGFFEKSDVTVVLEAEYRGVAVVDTTSHIPYLSKFAVEQAAQGEGMGRDLWAALVRTFPKVHWRARRTNPAVQWYLGLADGMVKSGQWIVFFRGIGAADIADTVRGASERPDDFEEG